MKKIKFIVLLLLMMISIDVLASSPAKLKNFSSSSTFKQGDTIVIDTKVVSGNSIGYPFPYVEYSYKYDAEVFEFVSFDTNYELSYDSTRMLVNSENSFTLDNYVFNEDEAVTIWTMTFKVKENAKIGETFIDDQSYLIIEKIESKNDSIVIEEDENIIDSERNDINIYLIITIVLAVVAFGELLYIVLKTKKA